MARRTITINDMHIMAAQFGGRCLSRSYKGDRASLTWQCARGHVWTSRPANIRNGSWCRQCTVDAKKPTMVEIQALAIQRGGRCLSKRYVNNETHLTWVCAKGHTWRAKPANVQTGTWCPFCVGQHQTIQDMRRLAESRGGKCLSKSYVRQNSKLLWQCKDGHQWKAVPNSIKNGNWCPKCSINYGEEIARAYFEAVFQEKFKRERPDWLEGLELDGYNEDLELAFEHHGRQHYEYVRRFHKSYSEFEAQVARDDRKRTVCEERGITLIEIPHIPDLLSLSELPEYLDRALGENGLHSKVPIENIRIDFAQIYAQSHLDILNGIAKRRGGQLLTQVYRGDRGRLTWKCENGHIWKAAPNNIKSGTWCPRCYGNVRKRIEEVRRLAAEKGFTLVSNEYEGTNSRLVWQCKYGHQWETSPKHIMHGTGCPKCAGCLEALNPRPVFDRTG